MALAKKERRITIAIGLIIGLTVSSLIVRHALKVKERQAEQRPGNYSSLYSASDKVKFPPLPDSVRKAIPNGIVVFFEGNRSSLTGATLDPVNHWVIETSGSFRSERLFILAEAESTQPGNARFLRATEIYVHLREGIASQLLEKELDEKKFRIIGQNSSSSEYIVQIRNFRPSDLVQAEKFLSSLEVVRSTRLAPWVPGK